jgi:hypothetical protein
MKFVTLYIGESPFLVVPEHVSAVTVDDNGRTLVWLYGKPHRVRGLLTEVVMTLGLESSGRSIGGEPVNIGSADQQAPPPDSPKPTAEPEQGQVAGEESDDLFDSI